MFLLKNFENLSEPGITVSETSTSQHDSPRISEMFLLLKNNYRKKFGTAPKFRIIGMDLSWATIHAALEVLNGETIEEYANRIYEYSKINTSEFNKTFLASCCSHTMHRFVRSLKRQVKFLEKEHRTFAVLCFTLLLNSLDFESSQLIFKQMCVVFLNDKYSLNVRIAQ
jgi:hypothetical protein